MRVRALSAKGNRMYNRAGPNADVFFESLVRYTHRRKYKTANYDNLHKKEVKLFIARICVFLFRNNHLVSIISVFMTHRLIGSLRERILFFWPFARVAPFVTDT